MVEARELQQKIDAMADCLPTTPEATALLLAAPSKADCIGCLAPIDCNQTCNRYRRGTCQEIALQRKHWIGIAHTWLSLAEAMVTRLPGEE